MNLDYTRLTHRFSMHLIAMLRRFSLMIPFVKLLLTQDGTAAVRPGKANFTIDDEYGDPSGGGVIRYNPSEGWGQGANCSGCWAMVDKTFAFDQTWHDSTADSGRGSRNMSITFSGRSSYHRSMRHSYNLTGSKWLSRNGRLRVFHSRQSRHHRYYGYRAQYHAGRTSGWHIYPHTQ